MRSLDGGRGVELFYDWLRMFAVDVHDHGAAVTVTLNHRTCGKQIEMWEIDGTCEFIELSALVRFANQHICDEMTPVTESMRRYHQE